MQRMARFLQKPSKLYAEEVVAVMRGDAHAIAGRTRSALHDARRRWAALVLLLLGCTILVLAGLAQTDAQKRFAFVIVIDNAIGPATSDYFVRVLRRAHEEKATALVLQLNTPGGLDLAMRDMIQAILASDVPVITYVSPSGARAASAGTYLLYASHIAAMAPATNLGAATPVQIGGSPSQPSGKKEEGENKDKSAQDEPTPGSASERKAVNDAVAYIRGLAELRGRNQEWAERAVRSAESLSASQALEMNVIDVIAANVPELLERIEGRAVKVKSGEITLRTAGLALEHIEADWRTKLLAVITNPNVAYLLMLAGIYGLLLEGYNPGAILPGVVGAVSLLLALYAFQVLSVNYAGLGLVLLGVVLIIAEAFAPSFGALGLGGIVAFVIGSIILMDTDVPAFRVATSIIGGVALGGALLMMVTVMYFARSRRRPVQTGAEQLLHEIAEAVEDFERSGFVRVRGETWRAVSDVPVKQGQPLRVLKVDGLTLHVTPSRN
jgi:membrane-bound serine protease (ClpP class)